VIVRDNEIFAKESFGFSGLLVVLSKAHVGGFALVGELQHVILRSDMELFACSMIAFPDRSRRPPIRTVFPIIAPEFNESRME